MAMPTAARARDRTDGRVSGTTGDDWRGCEKPGVGQGVATSQRFDPNYVVPPQRDAGVKPSVYDTDQPSDQGQKRRSCDRNSGRKSFRKATVSASSQLIRKGLRAANQPQTRPERGWSGSSALPNLNVGHRGKVLRDALIPILQRQALAPRVCRRCRWRQGRHAITVWLPRTTRGQATTFRKLRLRGECRSRLLRQTAFEDVACAPEHSSTLALYHIHS